MVKRRSMRADPIVTKGSDYKPFGCRGQTLDTCVIREPVHTVGTSLARSDRREENEQGDHDSETRTTVGHAYIYALERVLQH